MPTEAIKKSKRNNARDCRTYALKTLYGLTNEGYDRLFEGQSGRCALCGRHQSEFKRRLSVDHDHETGQVRGLLCLSCNRSIGNLGDNYDSLLRVLEYLA
jgi:hypothetical protein